MPRHVNWQDVKKQRNHNGQEFHCEECDTDLPDLCLCIWDFEEYDDEWD